MILAIIIFVAVVSLLAVGGGSILAARRRAALGSADRPALESGGAVAQLERTLRDVRVDDIVQLEGKDYLVEGVITYDEDGHTWAGARVIDGHDERWLVVGHERGGVMTVRLMKLDKEIEISGYPPEQIDAGGTRFAQDKRGTATAQSSGNTGAISDGPAGSAVRCRWWRYESAGDESVIVEQWGATFIVLRGKKVDPGEVDLMQAT